VAANESSTERPQSDRVDNVRSLFDQRENYLDKRQLDIRLRAETVKTLVEAKKFTNILDIGCGDGSVSVPVLTSECDLTLLDISPQMLSFARARVPASLSPRVRFVNQDFMAAQFDKQFDLVICLGVLAHVASPSDVIAKIVSVLTPGGMLILECTDGFHILGRINRLHNQAAWLFRPPKYRLNVLSAEKVLRVAEKHGLKATAVFRYGLPLPGMGRFFSAAGIYRFTRSVFGDVMLNRNRWLGNQFIYSFVRH
jgi:2-polyprenyl-3-methyl-5-hydroxy-6-metoxy-1,4-benzoquinol methylase